MKWPLVFKYSDVAGVPSAVGGFASCSDPDEFSKNLVLFAPLTPRLTGSRQLFGRMAASLTQLRSVPSVVNSEDILALAALCLAPILLCQRKANQQGLPLLAALALVCLAILGTTNKESVRVPHASE